MRHYEGGGRRGPWIGGDEAAPPPFQRADGSVMTNEEIAKVVKGEDPRPNNQDAQPARARLSDEQVDEAWRLANEIGQAPAARQLGLTQAGLQGRLESYQRRHGLTGELPGKMTREQIAAARANAQSTDSPESLRVESAGSPVADKLTSTVDDTVAPSESKKHSDAPLIGFVVHHGDPDARAAAFNEGYEKAVEDMQTDGAIEALVSWLTANGPTWSQADAERWLKAFTATVDLVYPTRAEG